MYVKRKPLFPKLHRCKWCKRRLDKNMDAIAYEVFLGDGVGYDGYYCDEKCAKAELIFEKKKREDLENLNKRINGDEDG